MIKSSENRNNENPLDVSSKQILVNYNIIHQITSEAVTISNNEGCVDLYQFPVNDRNDKTITLLSQTTENKEKLLLTDFSQLLGMRSTPSLPLLLGPL